MARRADERAREGEAYQLAGVGLIISFAMAGREGSATAPRVNNFGLSLSRPSGDAGTLKHGCHVSFFKWSEAK